jgi:hypothetical protein
MIIGDVHRLQGFGKEIVNAARQRKRGFERIGNFIENKGRRWKTQHNRSS